MCLCRVGFTQRNCVSRRPGGRPGGRCVWALICKTYHLAYLYGSGPQKFLSTY